MKQAFLYKFDDGSVDEEGKTNAILIISSLTDERDLRAEESDHDHGGMDYEAFHRVWQHGKLTKITSLEDVPNEWLGCLPVSTGELDLIEMSPEEFCEEMDENHSVVFNKKAR